MPNFRDLLAQDMPVGNDGDTSAMASPMTGDEVDELLYGDEWPAAERLTRLKALREELAGMEAADRGDDDPDALIGEIDAAIARLSGAEGEDAAAGTDQDTTEHRETMSPDDDDLLDLEEDEAAEEELDEVLDETEWEDGDGFDQNKGVR